MPGQRRINWGADATDARYRTEDTGDGANFVVAEDLDGATVLLEYDTSVTPSEWKVRGPVEMTGNDVSGVGTLTANSVETGKESISESLTRDFSEFYPHVPRGPEIDGPPALQRHPQISNPVVEPADVSGLTNVKGVADQFVRYNPDTGNNVLFCEILYDSGSSLTIGQGSAPPGSLDFSPIEELTTMPGANSWPLHRRLATGEYLFPTTGSDAFEIWSATTFPTDWQNDETTDLGYNTADHAPVWWGGRWYLIVYDPTNNNTRLFYEDSGIGKGDIRGGSWVEHPDSPIYGSGGKERLAGDPVVQDHQIKLWVQDVDAGSIYMDVISSLSTTTSSITESSAGAVVKPSRKGGATQSTGPWDGGVLHHVTQMQAAGDQPLYLIDGRRNAQRWRVGAFRPGQPRIAVAAPQSSAQTISNSTNTQLTFGGLDYDYGQGWDATNSEFVAPVDGVYQIEFTVDLNSASSGTELERWIKVNTTDKEKISDSLGGKFSVGKLYSRTVRLDAGDTAGAYVWHNEGSSLDTLNANTAFSVTRQ